MNLKQKAAALSMLLVLLLSPSIGYSFDSCQAIFVDQTKALPLWTGSGSGLCKGRCRSEIATLEADYLSLTKFKFNGKSAVRLSPRGGLNSGIFVIKDQKAKRLLKLNDPFWSPIDERLKAAAIGNFLCELVGGPEIIAVGKVMWNGKLYYYTEMELLFSGEDFVNLKSDSVESKASLIKLKLTSDQLRQIAELFIKAIELKINPKDPDFAIGFNGEVRWMDGEFWTYERDWDFTSASAIWMTTERIPKNNQAEFIQILTSKIDGSSSLPVQVKTSIKNSLELLSR